MATGLLAFSLAGCDSSKNEVVVDQATPKNTVGTWTLKKGIKDEKGFSPIQGAPITLEVTEKETFDGVSGCNNYMGSVINEGGELVFSVGGTTMKMCADDIMKSESSFLDVLATVDKGNLETKRGKTELHLLSPDETSELIFSPQG